MGWDWDLDYFQHQHFLTHFPFPKIPSRNENLVRALDSSVRTLDNTAGPRTALPGPWTALPGPGTALPGPRTALLGPGIPLPSSRKGKTVDWSLICCSLSRGTALTKLLWVVPISRGQDRTVPPQRGHRDAWGLLDELNFQGKPG